MKATESALKNALRSELEKHSKEELIDIIADLSSAVVFNSIIKGADNISRLNSCIANLQMQTVNSICDSVTNPFPDWSKSVFDCNSQCCSIRKNLMDD